ncbi:MAG: glycosyltransferase family 2 protein [Halobacteriaceae archaeon]
MTASTPDLSVIIVTMADRVDDVESLVALRAQAETASVDVEFIVRTDAGITTARNRGIDAASADKLVFVDDDALPAEGYLDAASRALDEHPVVAGRVDHPRDDVFAEFCDHYNHDVDANGRTDHVVGCNMAFRREVFEAVGYFDPALEWGHDETELIDRVREQYDVWYDPSMQVSHSYADSVLGFWQKMWRFGPADVYYGRKSDSAAEENGGVVRTLLAPSQFRSESARGTAVKSIGRVIRNVSIAKTVATGAVPTPRRQDTTESEALDFAAQTPRGRRRSAD